MDDILLSTDDKGGTAVLTTGSPMSHYGCPVLRIEAEDVSGDFGPADLIDATSIGGSLMAAAGIVAGWASDPERTEAEIGAARMYCAQWPDGPQV